MVIIQQVSQQVPQQVPQQDETDYHDEDQYEYENIHTPTDTDIPTPTDTTTTTRICIQTQIQKRYNEIQKVLHPSIFTIGTIHISIMTILILFLIRLCSVSIFGGHPSNLDYGFKGTGISDDTGTDADSSVDTGREKNIAFANDTFVLNTIGHTIQGILVSLLTYPSVIGLLIRIPIPMRVRIQVRIPNRVPMPLFGYCKRRQTEDNEEVIGEDADVGIDVDTEVDIDIDATISATTTTTTR
jgi:hypothetical protein